MAGLTPAQMQVATSLYKLGIQAGMTPQHATEFVAAAYAESGLRADAHNPKSGAEGEFQLLSPGYRQKAAALGGIDNPIANAKAILPDYQRYWMTHPGAVPGAAGAGVERSGENAHFYSAPLGVVGPAVHGPGAPVGVAQPLGAAPAAPVSSVGAFALEMLRQERNLEAGKPYDLGSAVKVLNSPVPAASGAEIDAGGVPQHGMFTPSPGAPLPKGDLISTSSQHPTEGLAGYPAHDYFAHAGTPVVAPVGGRIIKLSGHDPSKGPTEGPHGPFGWSLYLQGTDGRIYYLTHLGTRQAVVGQRVAPGTVLGTVGDYAKYGTPSHIHMGVH